MKARKVAGSGSKIKGKEIQLLALKLRMGRKIYKPNMLLVKTKLGMSKISGIGLFADQFIPKGTIIWKYTEGVDLKITDEKLAELEKEYPLEDLKKYLYRSKSSNLHILCGDDGRFINHAFAPNTLDTSEDDEGFTVASKDIAPGEEITSDYNGFDKDFENYRQLLK